MKKSILLTSVLITSVGLQACSTTGNNPIPPTENSVQPIVSSEAAFAHKQIGSAPITDSVQVSPSYYSYETSDMSISERKALLDILSHFQDADMLIRTAETQQSGDQRIKFRYDWLRKDLYKIKRGISDHLSSPEAQPRAFEPVVGDYRR